MIAIASHGKSSAASMAVVHNWECKAGRTQHFRQRGTDLCPCTLGYEGALLHRRVTGRLQSCEGQAAEEQRESPWHCTSCRLLWSGLQQGSKPLWPSRDAADVCSQGEARGALPNTDALAPREYFPTPPLSLSDCHPSHLSWLSESRPFSYILPKRHLGFAPCLIEDLFMLVCGLTWSTFDVSFDDALVFFYVS